MSVSDASSRLDQRPGLWRGFSATLAAAAASSAAAIFLFVLAVDPYGLRVGPGRPPSPIMDLNQRFMYPQIVRSARYDSAVFGTSTVRLLDPQRLGTLFGARFANLGLNAGTPWEQTQLARLLLGHVRQPKVLIFGLDWPWCSPDTDRDRLTFRTFPAWLYEERPLRYAYKLFSFKKSRDRRTGGSEQAGAHAGSDQGGRLRGVRASRCAIRPRTGEKPHGASGRSATSKR